VRHITTTIFGQDMYLEIVAEGTLKS
jgi:hypothetical protein